MASAIYLLVAFTISMGKYFILCINATKFLFFFILVALTINCVPIDSEASDAVEFLMNADELKSNHNDQPDSLNHHLQADSKREYPTEGILLGKRQYPSEGILIGKREYPTEGILLGKREYPTEGILLGKREYPTEGILLGKRNFRFFAPKSSGLGKHHSN